MLLKFFILNFIFFKLLGLNLLVIYLLLHLFDLFSQPLIVLEAVALLRLITYNIGVCLCPTLIDGIIVFLESMQSSSLHNSIFPHLEPLLCQLIFLSFFLDLWILTFRILMPLGLRDALGYVKLSFWPRLVNIIKEPRLISFQYVF